ncbi:DUF2691 family protein [Clostridium sp. D53t1_180928_C8]|uniref:DUF2691 family protein n=1 Tax=Clostridium sp. D53t1_180928_C8 TaxID=2787101 RepID=UPI0018AAF083|nr:DUF2691 family protein [Clostridium sp. D53t1_180928_C8]
MINGIRFEILNKPEKYLFEILKSINLIKYEWHIEDDEVYYNDTYENLFNSNKISGKELYKKISKEKYYIINIHLLGYKIYNIRNKKIESYEDFLKSKYEIMLVIYDSVNCEIYLKDELLFTKVYKSLEEKKFNPLYITEKNVRNKINIF